MLFNITPWQQIWCPYTTTYINYEPVPYTFHSPNTFPRSSLPLTSQILCLPTGHFPIDWPSTFFMHLLSLLSKQYIYTTRTFWISPQHQDMLSWPVYHIHPHNGSNLYLKDHKYFTPHNCQSVTLTPSYHSMSYNPFTYHCPHQWTNEQLWIHAK